MDKEDWALHRKLLFSLKEKAPQLLGRTMGGGSREIRFSYSRRSKLPCALCTALLLFVLCCVFPHKDSHKHCNKHCTVPTEM